MDLFSINQPHLNDNAPLAWRMRPQNLDDVIGQKHIIGPNGPLRKAIANGRLASIILYGPSGTGKTTLARIIARISNFYFVMLPAVSSGVSDLRKIAADAEDRWKYYQQRTVIFIDEIHRFNKNQQDVLLPYVEDGTLLLIGATTENPLYELNTALLSRVKIYVLEALDEADIIEMVRRALQDKANGLGKYEISIEDQALKTIVSACKGDGRMALNIVDTIFNSYYEENSGLTITPQLVEQVCGLPQVKYDRQGDSHYDTISAFIKSIRGSDPQAALYWLAVMLEGGEKPEFIVRRMLILAAEDVGLADPHALILVNAASQAVHFVGMPEARIILAEAVIYLAAAPKSNSSLIGIDQAVAFVRQQQKITVPGHIADSHHSQSSRLFKKGQNYKYPHDYNGYVKQSYLPPEAENVCFYKPKSLGFEKDISAYLDKLKESDD